MIYDGMPTIHTNGSDPQALLDALEAAAAAVFRAREALVMTGPNRRDYYLQGPGGYEAAVRAHDARAKRLADVQEELSAIQNHVVGAMDERRQRRP